MQNGALRAPPFHSSFRLSYFNDELGKCAKNLVWEKKSAKVLQLLLVQLTTAGVTVKTNCFLGVTKQRLIPSNPPSPIPPSPILQSLIPPPPIPPSQIITVQANKAAFRED